MNITIQNKELKDLQGMIIPVYEDKTHTCEKVEAIKAGELFKGKVGVCFYFTTEEIKYMI